MKLTKRMGGAAFAALLMGSGALHATEADAEYEFAPLPPGEGVDVVYYSCNACHSLMTVTNGGYSREVWDELLTWMVEEQGMWEMPPEDREIILNYLATYIGQE
jgi:hypothetical protein